MTNEKWLIDRVEFVKGCSRLLEEHPYIHHAANWEKGLELAVEVAMRQSPVDAVEVVRCKDCIQYIAESEYCFIHGACTYVDDFCSRGEKETYE